MNGLIFLKIGGSIITKKEIKDPEINLKNLKRICSEIAQAYNENNFKLVIVHGAGSYGHPIVKKTGIHKGITKPDQVLSFAETQLLQNVLNSEVCKALQEFKLPAIPVQPSASATLENKRLISINHDLIKNFIDISLIPVLFGVPAYDTTQKCSILSGDQIIVYLANKLKPQKIIFATNVDGILDKDKQVIEKISDGNYDNIKDSFYQTNYDDVTGSMAGKITELKNLAGIKSYIINGNTEGIISNILEGKKVRGTIIEF